MVFDNKLLTQNFIKLNISKLFSKGKIDKVYFRMFSLAEELAIHEMKRKEALILNEVKEESENMMEEYLEKISKYRDERFEFHLNQMKELLKLKLKE